MKNRAQCGITAGIAIVGAGVITLTPIAPPPTETFPSADAAVELMASPVQILADGVGQSGERLVQGLALLPLTPVALAQAIAAGDVDAFNYAIEQTIDAPLWVADPTIFALNDVLPAPFGQDPDNLGDDSYINAIRVHAFYSTTTELGAAANAAVTLTAGLAESALRVGTNLVGVPLGLIPISQAIAEGDKNDLYYAVRQYIDGPLWAADPTLKALNKVLAAPLGGDSTFYDDGTGNSSAVTKLRNEVLWTATRNVREPIRVAIGADPGVGDEEPSNGIAGVGTFSENDGDAAVKVLKDPAKEKSITGQDKFDAKSLLGSNKKTVGAHRKQTDGPIRAAVKQLRKSVKAASTPN